MTETALANANDEASRPASSRVGLRRRSVPAAALRKMKRTLTLVGRALPPSAMRGIRQSVDYVELGFWMREQGFTTRTRVRDRTEVFDAIAAAIGDRPALYLEFGVFEGASLRYWSQALRDPASELHAFDSFQGLPETFDPLTHPKGLFDVGGRLPDIDDDRIKYHVGWFSDTVPDFELPPHDQLLINLDAD